MSCRHSRKLAAYDVGALPEAEARELAAHVAACPACRRELAALQQTAALLAPAREADPPRDLWPDIRARLQPRGRHEVHRHAVAWRPALAMTMVLVVIIGALFVLPGLYPGVGPQLPTTGDDTVGHAQLAAAWDAPLADHEALGLAMLAMMDETVTPAREVAN